MAWLRAILFSSLFAGVFLLWLPFTISAGDRGSLWSAPSLLRFVGWSAIVLGGAIVVSCIGTFAAIGLGTPAPFDPPRRLVTRGPYGRVRNPMYLGGSLMLIGELILFGSRALALYGLVWAIVLYAFVVTYEEPKLRRTFGEEYERYCAHAGRWVPRFRNSVTRERNA